VITPRTTRLLRVPDLQAMHRVLADCVAADGVTPVAIVVPTSGAADALGRTLAHRAAPRGWFDLLTRDELYARLHERLPSAPPMLGLRARGVLTRAARRQLQRHACALQAQTWPHVEILAFWTSCAARSHVHGFDRLMIDSLQSSVEIDRGAERLFRQTEFLTATFTRFEALSSRAAG
jgi:hypothetical protein